MRIFLILLTLIMTTSPEAQTLRTPDVIYAELFTDVQLSGIFSDSKTFVDCIPKRDPQLILEEYREIKRNPAIRFSLRLFIEDAFIIPSQPNSVYESKGKTLEAHIDAVWNVLSRKSDSAVEGSSLIPLPYEYIVPGGRFREIYYWDSYFTMLGLKENGRYSMMEAMVQNFAYLINRFGHMPNGNRSYYLSRSQPPFFSLMLDLLASVKGRSVYVQYLPVLEKEYSYWMDSSGLTQHLVKMPDGSKLNRYWDQYDLPRPESYVEDVRLADGMSDAEKRKLYRDIRSAAESGWDFSSRWMKDGKNMKTLHTTDIIPVDLNALLYHMEMILALSHKEAGNIVMAARYRKAAAARRSAIEKYCWSVQHQWYYDHDLVMAQHTPALTLAGAMPFFVQMSDRKKCKGAAVMIRKQFLKAGGLVTTAHTTTEQWDAPNGWAPLQWITIRGLENYGENELAAAIAKRWIALNSRVFYKTGKLMEKYDVEHDKPGGGGEYPSQDGFGWTNGVLISLMKRYER